MYVHSCNAFSFFHCDSYWHLVIYCWQTHFIEHSSSKVSSQCTVVSGSEVQKALSKAQGLYDRWEELLQDETPVSRDELDWSTNELRNCLRAIDWDLEDLHETISILLDEGRRKNESKEEYRGIESIYRKCTGQKATLRLRVNIVSVDFSVSFCWQNWFYNPWPYQVLWKQTLESSG